jgi:hypothetical protein
MLKGKKFNAFALPAVASNVAAICRQGCCHMPATLLAAGNY